MQYINIYININMNIYIKNNDNITKDIQEECCQDFISFFSFGTALILIYVIFFGVFIEKI